LNILITGGAGYIGSHAAIELAKQNNVVIIDNLMSSNIETIQRIRDISGKPIKFIHDDIRNTGSLVNHLKDNKTEIVMHFAGLKSIRKSFQFQKLYNDINVNGTLSLINAMKDAGIFKLTFSSSATVYKSQSHPFKEIDPVGSDLTPYGTTKFEAEQAIVEAANKDQRWKIAILRYFNPGGAHHSGLHGEQFNSDSENLIPRIAMAALSGTPITIYGDTYPTKDGTPERDYIHIEDLINGHICAINEIIKNNKSINIWNLGTGNTHTVLEVINEFENTSGIKIKREILPPRKGDLATVRADSSKALTDMNWHAKYGLREIIKDTWRWIYLCHYTKTRTHPVPCAILNINP